MNRLKFKSVGIMLLINHVFYVAGLICFLIDIFMRIDSLKNITEILILFIIAFILLVFIFIQLFGGLNFLEFSKLTDNEIKKNKNKILGWTIASFYINFIVGIFAFIACYSIERE